VHLHWCLPMRSRIMFSWLLTNRHSHTLTMFWCDNAAHLSFPRTAFRTAPEVGSVIVLFLTLSFAGLAAFATSPHHSPLLCFLNFVFYCFWFVSNGKLCFSGSLRMSAKSFRTYWRYKPNMRTWRATIYHWVLDINTWLLSESNLFFISKLK